ncbi:DUF1707 SHOCT-like domain-containing protein [Amycolatopsis nigrescens]|uniref:DUF1707 SHOCT-like domain-containing protein n=1 Tax=Amycolatopsis nigrescens TaxID=381445 RepID=UPI00037567E9|nr:DUF1707 domain-containing protein [Amycolatopsis nigrescens]
MSDRPDLRLSDADREEALDALSEHVRTGRLDIDDFGDRSAKATAAKRRSELAALFADLPAPRPSVLLPTAPPPVPAPQSSGALATPWRAGFAVPIAAVLLVGLIFAASRVVFFPGFLIVPLIIAFVIFNRRRR